MDLGASPQLASGLEGLRPGGNDGVGRLNVRRIIEDHQDGSDPFSSRGREDRQKKYQPHS